MTQSRNNNASSDPQPGMHEVCRAQDGRFQVVYTRLKVSHAAQAKDQPNIVANTDQLAISPRVEAGAKLPSSPRLTVSPAEEKPRRYFNVINDPKFFAFTSTPFVQQQLPTQTDLTALLNNRRLASIIRW